MESISLQGLPQSFIRRFFFNKTLLAALRTVFFFYSASLILSASNNAMAQGTVPELLYYKFNTSGSGLTPNEANPATRVGSANGTLNGATVGGIGQSGTALLGNGGATASNSLSTGWTFSISGPWTISLWISGVTNTVTSNYLFGGSGGSTFRALTGTGVVAGGGNLEIRGTGMTDVFANAVFDAVGSPVVIHYVYNPAVPDIKVYINGVYNTSVTQTSTLAMTGTDFSVAGYGTNNGLPTGGKMDEFRFYNRALTAAEITQTWNRSLPLISGPNNAGVSALTSPTVFCAGTQQVRVKIADKGTNRLDSVRVNWQVDGVSQPTIYWTSPLDTLGSSSYPNDTILTLGSVTFASGIMRNVKVWTSMPNGVADTSNTDDTVNVNLKASLSGIYTIGGVSPDYPTLAAAAADLNNYGVCSPVQFNIRTGSYPGQISLGNIVGASAINTIRFQSEANHPDSVNISYTATATTDNYVIKLTGTKYISFKNLTLSANAASFSHTFDISGGCQFDTIQNCSLISATATASSANTAVLHTDGSTNTSLVVLNNVMSGGSWGMRLYGTSTAAKVIGTIVQGNRFVNQYAYGIYSYYHQNSKIRNNTITSTTTATFYGIHSYYGDSATEITGNRISGISVGYGLYIYYTYGSPAQPAIVANNSIQIGGTSTAQGIRSYYAQNNRIYHNSVNITSTSATAGYGGYFYYTSTTYNGNEIKNNIFANTGGGYAIYSYNPTLAGTTNVYDYNNLYTSGTVLAQIASPASTPANITAWRAASLQDLHSISYRPSYTSATNLQPALSDTASWALNGRAIHNTYVTTDIDGNARPTILSAGVPDIGAYEFTPTSLPPVATAVPDTPAVGTQSFLFAGDTIAKIIWSASSVIPSTIAIRQYSGVRPPMVDTTANNYMYFYTDIAASSGYANYDINLFYKDIWLGKNPSETDLKLAQNAGTSWTGYAGASSTVDTNNNMLAATVYFNYGVFTGTNNTNPLPVILAEGISATQVSKDVMVNWSTVSEINSNNFEIEVSYDGKNFNNIGTVKASGQSNQMIKYAWLHEGAFADNDKVLFYRIKMIDRDGSFEYSNTAVVVPKNGLKVVEVTAVPNPFNTITKLNITSQKDVNAVITVTDITGKLIMSDEVQLSKGFNSVELNKLQSHHDGLYFVKVNIDDETLSLKLLKASK